MAFSNFLYTLFFFTHIFGVVSLPLDKPKIAVCVCGQVGRLILDSPFINFFQPNTFVNFTLFYHLQRSYIHNTGYAMTPSPYFNFSEKALRHELEEVFLPATPHVSIGNISFNDHYSHEKWKSLMKMSSLDKIHQQELRSFQHLILEMYKHHVDCANNIIYHEQSSSSRFDFVLLMREDLFFFFPLDLQTVLFRMKATSSEESAFPFKPASESQIYSSELFRNILGDQSLMKASNTFPPTSSGRCHIVSKDCLKWGGMNIRFEFFSRVVGISLLQTRLSYYKFLEETHHSVFNPEHFDISQVRLMKWSSCEANVHEIPLAVARFKQGKACFAPMELWTGKEVCYAASNQSFATSNLCFVK